MNFGVGLFPTEPLPKMIELAKLSEHLAFSHVWVGDSHLIWREAYVNMAAAALNTSTVKLGTGVTGHVAETGRPVLLANALDCEFAIQIPGSEEVDESVIAVPLRYGPRVTGVVFLSKLGVGEFDESDLRLLEVLAGYAAVSLENARLYESLRLEAAHAKAWLEFADAISHASTPDEIADETVRATAALLECDVVSLWPYLIALFLLGIGPAWHLIRLGSFENRRWQESDHAE